MGFAGFHHELEREIGNPFERPTCHVCRRRLKGDAGLAAWPGHHRWAVRFLFRFSLFIFWLCALVDRCRSTRRLSKEATPPIPCPPPSTHPRRGRWSMDPLSNAEIDAATAWNDFVAFRKRFRWRCCESVTWRVSVMSAFSAYIEFRVFCFFFFRILLNFTVEAVSTNVWGSGKARCYRGGRWRNTRSTGFRSLTWDFCFGLPFLFGFLFCFSFATATLNGKSAAPTADGLDFGLDLSRAKIGNKHPRRATKQNGNDRAKRAAITQRRERSVLKERNLSSFFSFPFELGRNAPFYGAKSDEATEWRPIKLARNEGKHRRRAERIINAVMASGAEATTSCFLFCFTLKMKWKRRITTR